VETKGKGTALKESRKLQKRT